MYIKARLLNISSFLFTFLFLAVQTSGGENILPVPQAPPNDDPCNAVSLVVNTTCTPNTYTNAAATATVGPAGPSCGFYAGGDVWFSFVVPAGGVVQIQSQSGIVSDGAMAAYTGTCAGALTEIACDDDGGVGLMPQLTLTGLTPATTIFIRFWEYGNDNNGTFQICAVDLCPGAGAPPNDLPCDAQSVQLGVYTLSSTTMCATGLNEPLPGSCWLNGSINTVWYSVVAASTSLRIRCNPVTMPDPQIALYGGVCGTALVELGCNDDGPPCGTFSPYADLTVTGLVSGITYYIVVDGVLDDVGSFYLLAIDGAQPLPPIPGQDCGTFQPICGQSFTVGNPGFTGVGNICDFNGAGICLAAGERASAWYEFTTSAIGILEFNIVPNDWPGAPSITSTDYDFAVWKTAGAGAVTCANIAAGAIPLRCNFSVLGVTGIFSPLPGVSPPAYPGFGGAYDAQLNVVAGEKYVLVISNYSVSSSGFNLNFSGASPISYGAGPGATVYWSGSVSTDWFNMANWGGCTVPNCTTNAVVGGGIANQPLINGASANCKSLTINPGASLSLRSPQTLTICEDYINNGSLDAQAGSLILVNNANVPQQLSGNMLGSNAFPNLQINKTGSNVQLNQHIDLKGNLNIANATSVFNAGAKTVKIAGNFTNSGSYNSVVPGVLEFNGITAQQYNNNNTANLSDIRMNHKGTGLTLITNLNIGPAAKLTLDSGIIITNNLEVRVFNRMPAAVVGGSPVSYVYGSLKRYINSTGSYDFPNGHTSKGFQHSNINFAYPAFPTSIDNLKVGFSNIVSPPAPLGATDCGITFSNPGLDNGFWRFFANANSTTGKFDLTLYNLNYTNAATSNGWTIMSDDGSGWILANGACVPTPVTAVKRTGMTGILNFATAQSPGTPLPVEWLYLNARSKDNSILLEWATASEDNNAGFEVYRSINQNDFEKLGWRDGNGNSNVINTYTFEDKTAHAGVIYYYKLHQVDYNGLYGQSKIVTARLNYHSITVTPNPVLTEALISFYMDNNNVQLEILNSTGQVVKILHNGINKEGNQSYLLNPEMLGLASGCYMLRLIADDAVSHVSFCYIR